MFALDGGEAGFGEFVCNLVTAGDSKVVNGLDVFFGGHADGKEFAGLDVVHGLVAVCHVDGDLVHVADAAPGGHHGVGGTIFVVGADNQHGLGIQIRLDAKIFTHKNSCFTGNI